MNAGVFDSDCVVWVVFRDAFIECPFADFSCSFFFGFTFAFWDEGIFFISVDDVINCAFGDGVVDCAFDDDVSAFKESGEVELKSTVTTTPTAGTSGLLKVQFN